jgi:phosphatidylinositol-3-phosphatase
MTKLKVILLFMILAACQPAKVPSQVSTAVGTVLPEVDKVPTFDHIVLILLENRDYQTAINGTTMPHLQQLAHQNVLLSNYYAVTHPSLPNYIALVSGTTNNITSDCTDCFVNNQQNLADLLDSSGHTWKTYQENMPSPCFVGDSKPYYQKHNPFIYFDSIRLDAGRCDRSIVPFTTLDSDLASNQLPDFSLIMPNNCDSGHSCPAQSADNWAFSMVSKLQSSSALGQKSLIVITFDEGSDGSHASCCGMGSSAGGQVATILISPLAKPGFVDGTPYSHYSLLKTILMAWKLPDIGQTELSATHPILAPWLPGTSLLPGMAAFSAPDGLATSPRRPFRTIAP